MKFEELTPDQVEQAKKCMTAEERMAFIKESGIELSDEQLEAVSGGIQVFPPTGPECPKSPKGEHDDVETGRTRPGSVFGDVWPDVEYRCRWCNRTVWEWS